jgi:glycosyltransferase involved in cell wall biosynthesis
MNKKIVKRKSKSKILIISYDIIGKQMAGPGIRFYEFAKILSNFLDVTLVAPNRIDIDTEGFRAGQYRADSYRSLEKYTENADIILMQGHILYYFPFLKNYTGKIIIDLYNPFNLESLEMFKDSSMAERLRIDKNNINILKTQLTIGDYFICASEKQKDYWLGMLGAMGRVNPYNYDSDSTFKKLIDVVPFGIPSSPPKHTGESIRGAIPAIKEDDKIVLWGGGIWNWLDPITAIKALWEIARNRKDIKMVFIGIKHPDPKLPEMKKCIDAIKLSKELDLFEKYVFFKEWTPYNIRQNFLLESSVGLSIHQKRVETEFSYRTRVVDYVWAKLPIITTEGDSIAKMVKEENIGEVVGYENTHQLARVIEGTITNRSLIEIYKKNLNKIVHRFDWENVTRPLVKYCIEADYANDKKKIIELIDLQNSRISNVIKKNFEEATNVLVLTSNKYKDMGMLSKCNLGKLFYLEVDENVDKQKVEDKILDKVGILKSKIIERTKFDGIIVNNVFSKITPKFFYDMINVLGTKLKTDGLLFFSMPENRGLLKVIGEGKAEDNTGSKIDGFTIEYILENADFEIIDKGDWNKVGFLEFSKDDVGNIYGKNELFELFEIKLSRKNFKNLDLLKKFNMLESEELKKDKSLKGKFRKYMYLLTSVYFENLRKSYNDSIKAINNNIQLQINREINELNKKKNRERMLLIYFNIFKTLWEKIRNLGIDIKKIREALERINIKSKAKLKTGVDLDQKLDVIMRGFEDIDKVMGLSLSSKYYLVRKL